MHTTEQAAELWCPMARVAQVGAVETHAAYNRSLGKRHRTVKATWATADSFQLGEDAPKDPEAITILEVETGLSRASFCLAGKCAMWRWTGSERETGYCGLAGRPEVAA